MRKIDRSTAEHFQWNTSCDGWHLLKRNDLSVIFETIPAHTTEPMHYHCKSRQFFYILSGQVVMEFADGHIDLEEGSAIEIEPTKRHRLCNYSDSSVNFLMISMPTAHGDKVEVNP